MNEIAELSSTAPEAGGARRLNMFTRRVECALGRWTHSEARPADLSGLVEAMWHFDGEVACLRERTFPNGQLEIIVHLGEPYRDVHGDRVSVCPDTCVTGLQLRPMIIEAPGRRTAVLGIRLTVAGAYALFGRPLCELTGLTVDLQDVVGRAAAELQERCGGTAGPRACFSRAAEWVEVRLRRGVRADPAIAWTILQIERHGGAIPIARLRERAGLSVTRFAASFREQVGVTAKQYARVIRFKHVLGRLNAGADSLADLAHGAGYYDQPHMNAEFKELSGLTPGEFLHSRRYPNSVSVAE